MTLYSQQCARQKNAQWLRIQDLDPVGSVVPYKLILPDPDPYPGPADLVFPYPLALLYQYRYLTVAQFIVNYKHRYLISLVKLKKCFKSLAAAHLKNLSKINLSLSKEGIRKISKKIESRIRIRIGIKTFGTGTDPEL
jgi:hypothetical protein